MFSVVSLLLIGSVVDKVRSLFLAAGGLLEEIGP